MKTTNPELPDGYSPVPEGKIANMVTCLEMRERPANGAAMLDAPFTLARLSASDMAAYRHLFRAVGEEWMWVSVLTMADDAVLAFLDHPAVETYALRDGARDIGLLQLDFREPGECELVYFGVVKDAIGRGLGRALMNEAVARAWSHPIRRFWLHTCTFDHPAAIAFYQRSGFVPYARMVEVHDDPRLTGLLPKTVASHIPLLDTRRPG